MASVNKLDDLGHEIYDADERLEVDVLSIKEKKDYSTVYIGSVTPPFFSDSIMQECKQCGEIIDGWSRYMFRNLRR